MLETLFSSVSCSLHTGGVGDLSPPPKPSAYASQYTVKGIYIILILSVLNLVMGIFFKFLKKRVSGMSQSDYRLCLPEEEEIRGSLPAVL